jgi:hypothetical protein
MPMVGPRLDFADRKAWGVDCHDRLVPHRMRSTRFPAWVGAHDRDLLADGCRAMKSLIVHVDGSPRCAARLRLAIALARGHAAHLTALFAGTPPLLGMPYSFAGGAETVQILQDLYVERRAKARSAFQVVAAGTQAEWAELGALPLFPGFAGQALFADLMVLGQHEPASTVAQDVPTDFVEWTLIDSGKPALVNDLLEHPHRQKPIQNAS